MVTAAARFADLAPRYDAARPQAPAELAEVLMQWSGRADPDVVDVGGGTGLSTVIWVGRARQVTAVEPGDRMRAVALGRLGLNPDRPAGVLASSGPGPAGVAAPSAAPAGAGPAPVGAAGAGWPAPSAAPPAARPTAVTVTAGSAEATGLPDECADIVTASQAMHWFDAERALPEVIRILRPGGLFAAYDYD